MKLLFILSLLFVSAAQAQTYNCIVTRQTDFGTSTVSHIVLNKNAARRCLIVQNHAGSGSSVVYVKFGSAHTGTEGLVVAGNSTTWEAIHVPTGSMYLKAVPGGHSVTVIEGQ